MSVRAEKVASLIKRSLVEPVNHLAEEFSAGLVTITSVKLTNDLHIAKVYVSIFSNKGGPGEFMHVLQEKSKMLRTELAHHVRLRYTPELRFYLDDTLEQMEHIQDLLNSIKKSDSDNTGDNND